MPDDPFAQPGTAPGAGGEGSSSPELDAQKLKDENATLREEKRQLTSKLLGVEHKLTPTQIELLAGQPVDKQGEIAAKLAAEQTPAPAPAPATDPPAGNPPPPVAPPDPVAQQPDLARVGNALDGGPVNPPPANWQDQMHQEVVAAKDSKELEAIQQKWQRIASGQEQYVPPAAAGVASGS